MILIGLKQFKTHDKKTGYIQIRLKNNGKSAEKKITKFAGSEPTIIVDYTKMKKCHPLSSYSRQFHTVNTKRKYGTIWNLVCMFVMTVETLTANL